jgi:hypothetical protein
MPHQPEKLTSADLEALSRLRGEDSTLDWMMSKGMPLTRDSYILANWGPEPPEPWTAEHEAEIPEPLQDMRRVIED